MTSRSPELGRGAYGSVTLSTDREVAIKTFEHLKYLVQEAIAITYLRDCSHIVHSRGLSLRDLELRMEVYPTSLRGWLQNMYRRKKEISLEQREIIERDILLGLNELHSRGLTHGDIKPSNILVQTSPFSLVLGDLGFVSVSRYSKVERTAAAYRDPNPSHSPSHDMFSFGIILLELEGGVRPTKQCSYEELQSLTKKNIPPGPLQAIVLSLFSPDHQERPTASGLLHFFSRRSKIGGWSHRSSPPSIPKLSYLPKEQDRKLKKWIRGRCSDYQLHRGKRAYFALSTFFNTHPIPSDSYRLYSCCMLLILSSIFGSSGYDEEKVLEECRVSRKKSRRALTALVQDLTVVTILLLPTK